jgi:NADPH-dependent 2,4-dienoyl-CoA reductase/sulfur reductase-like enzyme
MSSYKYVVVGGGMAGDMVCRGIRDHDADGAIALIGDEPHAPYKRPPLSKGLWSGGDEAKLWRKTDELGVQLFLGRTVVSLDLAARTVRDDLGDDYTYERLVLATGGTPRRLGGKDGEVVYFRTYDDYKRLRELSDRGGRFVVVGGGFIGSEIAAALKGNGNDVTMVFPEPGIGWRTFPEDLAHFVTGYYRDKGIDVRTEAFVDGVEGTTLTLAGGETLEADAIVAGLGIVPRAELVHAAGLESSDGIEVDEHARVVGMDDVYAAGDVALFPGLGRSRRVEHEDHANVHGRLAGANAAGAGLRYDHVPYFYSDLFDLGYEAVGVADARTPTVELWLDPNRKGIVGYTDGEGRARGFLLWNVWDKVDPARELIDAGTIVDEDVLRSLAG